MSVSERTPNTFIQIFEDYWNSFKEKYPSYNTEYYEDVINKMIHCGDPNEGFIEYQCTYCGKDSKIIGFSCKSNLCLRCGAVRAMDFVEEVMAKLHPGMVYRHLTLTIPEQLREIFYKNRHTKDLYNRFYQVGWECICDLLSWLTGIPPKNLKCGCIMVMHLPGRDAKYNPHLHIILQNGALDMVKEKWMNLSFFPYEVLRKKWQWHLSNMIIDFDSSKGTKKLIDNLWKEYKDTGFVFNIDKRDVPKRSLKLAKYLSKYLFRPAISIKRILEYNKEDGKVLYEYACHETGKVEQTEVDVFQFIGRMVQQVLPKGFQRVRYLGLQATSSYRKSREQIVFAIDTGIVPLRDEEGEIIIARAQSLKFREKILKWTGKDPLKCKNCGRDMELVKVWIKGKGTVFDYYQELMRAPPEIKITPKNVENVVEEQVFQPRLIV
jgi:hypothetical protein